MRNRLLVFGGFADDTQSVLATICPFALVLRELVAKEFLCVRCYFEGIERHIERSRTVFADTQGGYSSEPFNDPQITFSHTSVSHRQQPSARPVDFQMAPAP